MYPLAGGKMLKKHFETLPDGRVQGRVHHSLLEIVMTTILAVLKGCESWYHIVDFAKARKSWLKEHFEIQFAKGIPSHDTFQRIFELLNPKEFEKRFVSWVRAICKLHKNEFVNIDGKTVCGSRKADNSAIHIVSAWANQNRLVLGQRKVNDKSNEITAIPELLDLLELKGCIITIDAMGCQRAIAEKICSKKAGYVLALKANQNTLYDDVKTYFEGIPYESQPLLKEKTQEKSHGRVETREYWLTTDIFWIGAKDRWAGLKSIGKVESKVHRNGKATTETRYYISSLTDIDLFSKAVRSHWGIENSLHWCLDVIFDEDRQRSRKGYTAENLALARKIVMNMLQKTPTEEPMSLKGKLKKCAYDEEFFFKVILHNSE